MESITIGLIQSDIHWEDEKQNLVKFEQTISGRKNADILVLPEMFSTGFSMSVESQSQTMQGSTVNWMVDCCDQYDIDLIGSLIINDSDSYFNRLLWVGASGKIEKYDKKHLFSLASENDFYSAGVDKLISTYHGWNIATFICYDLRFPVWSRNKAYEYDIAIYIANWPETRKEQWRSLLVARAIENQSYVVAVNRVGTDGNGLVYNGDSMVIDPLGNVIFSASQQEMYQEVAFSKSSLLRIRESFPFVADCDPFYLK